MWESGGKTPLLTEEEKPLVLVAPIIFNISRDFGKEWIKDLINCESSWFFNKIFLLISDNTSNFNQIIVNRKIT